MRPYSMAVAPDSSFTKRSMCFCMTTLPTTREQMLDAELTLFEAVEALVNVVRRVVDWEIFH